MKSDPTQETLRDFKRLFNLVCTRHQGPVIADFGRQMYWQGIVAAQYTPHIMSLQADGLNAFYDDRHGDLQFSQGTPHMLAGLLAQYAAE